MIYLRPDDAAQFVPALNLCRLARGAMIAPQIEIVERAQPFVDGNHGRPRRGDGEGRDDAARDASIAERSGKGLLEGAPMIRWTLHGIFRLARAAQDRVGRRP